MMLQFITLCISLIVCGSVANDAQFIKPCKQTDSDCIINSANIALTHMIPGVESLGLPALDPLFVGDIALTAGDLKLNIKDMVVHRLGQCTFNNIERDPEKSSIFLDIDCPVTAVGNYQATGRLLFVPIEGVGPFEVKTDKLRIMVKANFLKISKHGKYYYKISDSSFNYEPLSKFSFRLENLFNGDKAKAEPINDILDSSGNELVMDPNIGKPIIREIYNKLSAVIVKLFQTIPSDQLEIV